MSPVVIGRRHTRRRPAHLHRARKRHGDRSHVFVARHETRHAQILDGAGHGARDGATVDRDGMALAVEHTGNGIDLLIGTHGDIRAELDGGTGLDRLGHVGRIAHDENLACTSGLYGIGFLWLRRRSIRRRSAHLSRLDCRIGAVRILAGLPLCRLLGLIGRIGSGTGIGSPLFGIACCGNLIGHHGGTRTHLLGKCSHSGARAGKDKRHEHHEEFPRNSSDVIEHPFPLFSRKILSQQKNEASHVKGKRNAAGRPHQTVRSNVPTRQVGHKEYGITSSPVHRNPAVPKRPSTREDCGQVI